MVKGAIGRGGSGKSLYTVSRLWARFLRGRDIASNSPLIDLAVKKVVMPNGVMPVPDHTPTFGRSWASWYLTKLEDLYSLDNCDAFLDEIAAWMGSHMYREIPEETRRFLSQDRREGVDMWWTHRTLQVFDQVRASTAEVCRCQRYGPLVVVQYFDPEERDGKRKSRKFVMVSPRIYQKYDTMARVGNAKGQGYGVGKRTMYRAEDIGRRYKCLLPTMTGSELPVDIRLTAEQAACMLRMWGPESIGLHRERKRVGDSFVTRFVWGPVLSPGLTDETPEEWRRRLGLDVMPDDDPDYLARTQRLVYAPV